MKHLESRLLVIDDDIHVCRFIKDLSEDIGMEVVTCIEGARGVELALTNSFQLILLDLRLNDHDGIDILKILKAASITSKIVIISGYLTDQLIKEAMDLGADGYLYKPLSIRDIISKAYQLVEQPSFPSKSSGLYDA